MKKSVEILPVEGKKVLLRVDFNVPIKNGNISDDTRIVESLPTIRHLLSRNAKVLLCSHLGRPKGVRNEKYTLRPVARRLSELLGENVLFAEDCIGENALGIVRQMNGTRLALLENLRFHAGEEKNDPVFAASLSEYADCFVQDAFGAVHRAHASTSAVAKLLPSAAGLLLQKELDVLGKILENPDRPFLAILGGAKVSDKISVLENLLKKTEGVFVGGAMAYTFLKAKGFGVGKSLVEEDRIELARKNLTSKLHLPQDHRTVEKVEAGAKVQITSGEQISDGQIAVDIGPKTSRTIESLMKDVRTVFWNGPLGIFEIPEFSQGTMDCAKAVAAATDRGAFTVVGGGDSISALKKSGLSKKISHISTGGGASLEFLEGKSLPGIEVLPNG